MCSLTHAGPSPQPGCGGPAHCGTGGSHLLPPTEPLVHEPWRASCTAGQGHPCPLRHHLRLWLHRDANPILDCGRGETSLGWLSPLSCTTPYHPVPSYLAPPPPTRDSPLPAQHVTSHTFVLSQPSHPTLSHWHIQCYPIYTSHLVSAYPIPLCSILPYPILSHAVQICPVPSNQTISHPTSSYCIYPTPPCLPSTSLPEQDPQQELLFFTPMSISSC